MIPILLGVTLITFVLFNVVIDDPALQFAGKNATVERLESIRRELGTDKPLHIQYLNSLKSIVTWDFGRSWQTRQTVTSMISEGMGPSISLMLPGFFATVLLAICLSLGTALFRGKPLDKVATMVALAMMSTSTLVYVLFFQHFFSYKLGWFPITGWDPSWIDRWGYLVLPWIIIVISSIGSNFLIYRTAVLDEFYQDYVRTARAKGVAEKKVLFKHVLKNAMIPIITLVVLQMPFLLTGSLLLEAFFGIPGLGGTLVQAIFNSDFPVIRAMVVVGSILYMGFSLLSDLLYALVNPRIRLG
jgi:peptide/nickel transport system permease protein